MIETHCSGFTRLQSLQRAHFVRVLERDCHESLFTKNRIGAARSVEMNAARRLVRQLCELY